MLQYFIHNIGKSYICVLLFIYSFIYFFRAATAAHGSSQARDPMQAIAAALHHSHSNVGSKPHLWPTLQLWQLGSLTHWARPGIEPTTSWTLVMFIAAKTRQELHNDYFFLIFGPLMLPGLLYITFLELNWVEGKDYSQTWNNRIGCFFLLLM